jgi:lipopolysaccharide export system protein LptC
MASIRTAADDLYQITADEARFDGTSDDLDLMGNILVTSSSGYSVKTEQLSANLGTTGMIADGPIEGTAPGGTIEAGRMELIVKDGAQLLVFTNGVRLVYDPDS